MDGIATKMKRVNLHKADLFEGYIKEQFYKKFKNNTEVKDFNEFSLAIGYGGGYNETVVVNFFYGSALCIDVPEEFRLYKIPNIREIYNEVCEDIIYEYRLQNVLGVVSKKQIKKELSDYWKECRSYGGLLSILTPSGYIIEEGDGSQVWTKKKLGKLKIVK